MVWIENCKLIDLPKIADPRGNLTFLESSRHIPFEIKRVYYLYDVPGGAMRAGHAHKALHQFLVAMSGSFDVLVDDKVVATEGVIEKSGEFVQRLYTIPAELTRGKSVIRVKFLAHGGKLTAKVLDCRTLIGK